MGDPEWQMDDFGVPPFQETSMSICLNRENDD